MNEIICPRSSEKSKSKCPLWKFRRGFNQWIKMILDNVISQRKKLRKLESFANRSIQWLKDIDFLVKIEESNLTIGRHELLKFFCDLWEEILPDNQNMGQIIWIGIADILSALLLYKNYWVNIHKYQQLVTSSMEMGLEITWEDWKKINIPISFLIDTFVSDNKVDPGLFLSRITSINKINTKWNKCDYWKSPQKTEFITQIWEILENKFLPALQEHYKDRDDLSREEFFYLWKFKDVKGIVIERAATEMIPFLESVDLKEFIGYCEGDFNTIPDLKVGRELIGWWVQDLLSSFVFWELEIKKDEMDILMRQKKTSIKKNIINVVLLWPLKESFMDIYNVYLLHKSFWISEELCKRFIHMGMIDGSGLEQISQEIEAGVLNKDQAESIIEDSIDVATWYHVCPFFKAKYKKQWVNIIWDIIRNEFLPALQEKIPEYKKDLSEEELFYLGRYN